MMSAQRFILLSVFIFLKVEFSSAGCKYFSPLKNGTLEYFAPDVCYQTRSNGTISSYKWQCATDGQSVSGKYGRAIQE